MIMKYFIHRRRTKRATSQVGMLIVQSVAVLVALLILTLMAREIGLFRDKGKSIPTGALSKAKTGMDILQVTGFSIDANQSDIQGLIITAKPSAGSDPIDLSDTNIMITVGNRTAYLKIRNGTTKRNKTSGFYTD